MVAPLIAAAGISAVGSVLGGISGGKGAKKQAQLALQGQRETIAAADRNRDYQYNLNAPTITNGGAADSRIAALLNLGGDRAAAEEAFRSWRDSTGYQSVLREGLTAVNNSRFAGGAGQSGATLRKLQDRGSMIADGTFNNYMGHAQILSNAGAGARGLVAGVGGQTVNTTASAIQNGTAGQMGAVQAGTNNTQQMIQNLANIGSYAAGNMYGSSYKPNVSVNPPGPWYQGY